MTPLGTGEQSSGGHIVDADGVPVVRVDGGPGGSSLLVGSASTSKGNKRLTLAGTSVLLSSVSGGIPAGATKCIIRPAVAINFNDDGTPATTSDYPIAANVEWVYDGDQLAAVRLIGTGDVDLWFYA